MSYVAIQKKDGTVKIFPGKMRGTPAPDVCLLHGVETQDERCRECAHDAYDRACDLAYDGWNEDGRRGPLPRGPRVPYDYPLVRSPVRYR